MGNKYQQKKSPRIKSAQKSQVEPFIHEFLRDLLSTRNRLRWFWRCVSYEAIDFVLKDHFSIVRFLNLTEVRSVTSRAHLLVR